MVVIEVDGGNVMKENKKILIVCGVIGAFLLLILVVSVSSSGLSELESKYTMIHPTKNNMKKWLTI